MSDCVTCGGGKGQPVKITEAASAARSTVSALAGNNKATPEQIEERATSCLACPNKKRKHGMDFCGDPFIKTDKTCGCILWAKIRVNGEECPSGHW